MRVNLKDVAQLAGVSVATASLALNNKGASKETIERVMAAAKKLNYVQNSLGRSLITGRSYTIALYILNDRDNPDLTGECTYFYPFMRGILGEAEKAGYALSFAVKLWDDAEKRNVLVQSAQNKSCDGMIIVPQYTHPYSFLPDLERLKFPYVMVNPSTSFDRGKSVSLDNYAGAAAATQHLLESGCRKPAYINGSENHFDAVVRKQAFLDVTSRAGLEIGEDSLVNGNFTTSSGATAMKELLRRGADFDGIFCANDYMAAGAMNVLLEAGYRIPEDVQMIGFDDTEIARSMRPGLTTVHNPTFQIGVQAMRRLLAYIADPNYVAGEKLFQAELVIRDSTRKSVPFPTKI
ncbi:putative HTH-type transcriptional repressor ExuR [Peptococcaceae bacterium CEB3]|nr:putative HTH-type transcriptional repressor ExuR [Peptococcaceae bacterium CEB3]